ncbi:MAG: hypothetical protein AAF730_06725 [Bacteroidota bacterium]
MEEPLKEILSVIAKASTRTTQCYFKAREVLENNQRAFESPYGRAVISADSSLDALRASSEAGLAQAWHLVGHKPRMVKPSTHPTWAPFVEDVYSVAWESADERIAKWIIKPKSPFLGRGTHQLNRLMRRISLWCVEEGWVLRDTLSPGERLKLFHLDMYCKAGRDRQRGLLKITWGPLKTVCLHEAMPAAFDKVEPEVSVAS